MGTFAAFWLIIALGSLAVRPSIDGHVESRGLQFHVGLTLLAPLVLVAGSCSLSMTIFFVSVLGLLAGIPLVIGLTKAAKVRRDGTIAPMPFNALEWTSIIALAGMNLLALILVAAPVTGWDATVAHLSVPASYERMGRIGLVPGNVYSAYPQFLHALFSLGAWGGNPTDAITLNWTLNLFACYSVGALAHKLGGQTAGLIAAAMFSTAPIFIAQAGTVAIDVPFAGFVASSLLALVIWDEAKSLRYLAIGGVIVGASCGIRHTGYFAALLMFGWVLIQSRDSRAKSVAIFAAAVFMASAPWWLRSWILVGNPVYPLMTSVFGDGGMPDVQVTTPLQHETARGFGVIDFVTFPWRIAMHPDAFDGWQASPGGLVVALGVVGVLFGGRLARWLGGFSLAGFVTIYMVQRFARYLFPFLMPLHVTGALVATRPGPLRRPIAALLIFSYIYGLGLAVGTSYFKWPVVFGLESREHYLTQRVERYPAFQWINEHVPEDATVLTLDPRSYYIRRSSFQNLAALAQLSGKTIDTQLEWMAARGIRYILIPDAYVASSPVFREWGITPLIDGWRGDARFRSIYDEDLPELRGGGTEHVTILEVVWGGGDGAA